MVEARKYSNITFLMLTPLLFVTPDIASTKPVHCITGSVLEEILGQNLKRRLKIYGGISIPSGDFADADPRNINAGFAYPGVSVGLECTSEVTNHLGFAAHGMISLHGQDVSGWKHVVQYWIWEQEDRVFLWAMGGLYFDTDLSESFNIYGTTQIGILYGNYPNLTVKDTFGDYATLTAPSKTSAAYKLGLGIAFNKFDFSGNVVFSDPEFEPTYQYKQSKTQYPSEQKPVRAVLLTIGYILN